MNSGEFKACCVEKFDFVFEVKWIATFGVSLSQWFLTFPIPITPIHRYWLRDRWSAVMLRVKVVVIFVCASEG